MRAKFESNGRGSWKAFGIATLLLSCGAGAFGQQFVSRDSAAGQNCLKTISGGPGDAGTVCDARAVEQLTQSGQAFSDNQQGIESALVLGSGKTVRDARKWFEKAARQGYAPAQVNLAVLYLNGWGVEKNYGTALYWLSAAAKQENARAHTNLGILYLNGWGVRQDYSEAAMHFRFAAEHGETSAMVNLGYLSDAGLGTPKDSAEAVRWYRLAAERGDALGENNLGDIYLRGLGVEQSDEIAKEWFEKAAEQGNTAARIKLGYLYASGRAGRTDAELAYALISAAELAGDKRGQVYFAPLEKQLSAEQIARAKQKAQSMLSTPQNAKMELAFLR
ncbi:MAG TPA: tetratricopeptide repeat protein [Candidatus Acidoferrum sp.]|nr:tetratricopeptide repeat protein [Candidatus Acidoferrum sp.]